MEFLKQYFSAFLFSIVLFYPIYFLFLFFLEWVKNAFGVSIEGVGAGALGAFFLVPVVVLGLVYALFASAFLMWCEDKEFYHERWVPFGVYFCFTPFYEAVTSYYCNLPGVLCYI